MAGCSFILKITSLAATSIQLKSREPKCTAEPIQLFIKLYEKARRKILLLLEYSSYDLDVIKWEFKTIRILLLQNLGWECASIFIEKTFSFSPKKARHTLISRIHSHFWLQFIVNLIGLQQDLIAGMRPVQHKTFMAHAYHIPDAEQHNSRMKLSPQQIVRLQLYYNQWGSYRGEGKTLRVARACAPVLYGPPPHLHDHSCLGEQSLFKSWMTLETRRRGRVTQELIIVQNLAFLPIGTPLTTMIKQRGNNWSLSLRVQSNAMRSINTMSLHWCYITSTDMGAPSSIHMLAESRL